MLGEVELHPDYPLVTRRLRLRPLSAADTEDLVAYRSLEDVCRYVPLDVLVELTDELPSVTIELGLELPAGEPGSLDA